MKSIAPMKKIMLVLCSFGLFMGLIFPLFASFFIQWIPGKIIPFVIGCLIAGCLVGMFGYFIINTVLKRIDNYYKKTLFDKLNIVSDKRPPVKSDLLLHMIKEFEDLINKFSIYIKKENERLKELSIIDSLTSLYNHRHLFEYFQTKLNVGCKKMSILFCDIDHFKLLNDLHGHQTGDLVLKEVGNVITNIIGKDGAAFRYGGEEFVIILHCCSPEAAYEKAEQIRIGVGSMKCVREENCNSHVTISIGIASYPTDALSLEGLIEKADKAMYFAKQNGRNQCHSYSLEVEQLLQKGTEETLKQDMLLNSVFSLIAAIDAKDSYTEKHSEAVVQYSIQLAEKLKLSNRDKYVLKLGGILHDCGKIGIPDNIIYKSGSLTDEEFTTIKNHTLIGGDIIRYIIKTPEIETCIRHHHERWDGKGYPDGLSGLSIPIYARIISIADSYHAMTSDRPYRKALSQQQAFHELSRNKGTQFDPQLVDSFVSMMSEFEYEKENKFSA